MTGIPGQKRKMMRDRIRKNRVIFNPGALDQMDELGRIKFLDTLKTKFKEAKKSIKDAAEEVKKKGGQRIAKIGLAPARASFLAAVNLNVLKLATKLSKLWKKNPGKIKEFWSNFGGEPDKLKRAIEKGSKQALSGLGEPITLTGALASAVPILIKVFKLFKQEGVDEPGDEAKQSNLVDQAKGILELDNSVEKDNVNLPKDPDTGKAAEVTRVIPREDMPTGRTTPEVSETESKPFYKQPAVLIGGAVVLGGIIYLATRKKK